MGFLGQARTSREEADHVRRSFSECGQFHRRKKRESRVSVGAADRRQVCGNNSCWDHDAVSCSPDFRLSPVNPSIFHEELGSSHVFELSMRAWITRRQEFWRTIARTGRSCGTQRPPRTIRTPRRRRRTTLSNASIAGSLHIARRSWGSAAGGLDLAKGKQLSVDQNVERYCKEEEDECPDRSDSPFFRLVLWGVTGDGVTRQMLPVFRYW